MPVGQVVIDELSAHLATYGPAQDGSLSLMCSVGRWSTRPGSTCGQAIGTSYKTHDLRHYAASALIAGGAVTFGVYAHLWPGDDDRARTILDAALADCVRTKEVVG